MVSSASMRGRVLLASASAGGTIAAVRNLAANGFEVRVLSSEVLGAAAWSRCVTRSYAAPPESENQRFLLRLLEIGKSEPGQILLPTSDETTWLYAKNSELLEPYFRLYQPSISIQRRILDKCLLAEVAGKAGVASLPTWDPQNIDELKALATELPYPILIKPRTHVHRLINNKGAVVGSVNELLEQYQLVIAREKVRDIESPLLSEAVRPILQQFVNVGSDGIQSVTGFIDRWGKLFVTRRSRKVFQRSRPVGVGVCYESLPPDPSLSRSVHALCCELGYFGMFEVEFLSFAGGWAVIDFNPRLYNQIGLDIGRGLPLPVLACLGALDDEPSLRDMVLKAKPDDATARAVFYDRFTLQAMLFALAVTSRISHVDLAYWRSWMKQNTACAIDVAAMGQDPLPSVIHALSETCLGLKGIGRFLRSSPRTSPGAPRAFSKGQP
jgi:D-aspartate ligase